MRATADLMRALKALSLSLSPSDQSMARRVLPSRLELKSFAASSSAAPWWKVTFTVCL